MTTAIPSPAPARSDVVSERSGLTPGIPDRFLSWFVLVLCGYAVGSKGFAYLGVPPIFIGEVSMLVGAAAFLVARGSRAVWRSPLTWWLLAFMSLSAARTVPFLGEYGMLALRDAAFWGYGVFAIVMAGLVLARPQRLDYLLREYRRLVPVLLVAVPIMWLATIMLAGGGPKWPGSNVPIIGAKGTDFLVQLSGVVAFMCVGFFGRTRGWLVALLAVSVVLTGFNSRGGLLAFLCAFAIGFAARPRSRSGWSLATMLGGAAALLAVSGVAIRFPGMSRDISFTQFVQSFATTAGGSAGVAAQDLENTKQWRLAWWAVIITYTIDGDYFWTGKGYGINLADDDGFQVQADNSLRTPHNVHMTVLARSGVPGLALWLGLQIVWGFSLARGLVRARREHAEQWASLFAFLLAFWLSFLVNATFDVYLEGPTGGIWFWSVFGVGIAAAQIYSQSVTDSKRPMNSRAAA